jgi:hypothetical protein
MGRKPNNYFGAEEEQAINDFNAEYDNDKKNIIFNTKLQAPFLKMIESILNRYKLYDNSKQYQNMINDCFSYVYEKIEKYDSTRRRCTAGCTKEPIYVDYCPYCGSPTRGLKAYSFFGTIIKRYLITERNKGKNTKFEFIEPNDNTFEERDDLNVHIMYEEDKSMEEKEFFRFLNNYFKMRKDEICQNNEQYKSIFEALMIIMKDPTDVNFYNKKYVYLLIKELTGIEEQSIVTEFFNIVVEYYLKAKKEYWV